MLCVSWTEKARDESPFEAVHEENPLCESRGRGETHASLMRRASPCYPVIGVVRRNTSGDGVYVNGLFADDISIIQVLQLLHILLIRRCYRRPI
jgi:hypothetical protein